MARRTPATARGAKKAAVSRGWYHARWIAINLALIGVTAYLYAYHLIPRFILGEQPPTTANVRTGNDAGEPARSMDSGTAGSAMGSNRADADQRAQPAVQTTTPDQGYRQAGLQHAEDAPSLSPPQLANVDRWRKSIKDGTGRCIGGTPYIVTRSSSGETTAENIPGLICNSSP